MLTRFRTIFLAAALLSPVTSDRIFAVESPQREVPIEISGRYPHLATLNKQGECGTGAVVPWADRLWVITYAPHKPGGSDDKLYEIDSDLNRTVRPESVGGTPANRMIHRESRQLNIGPYFIDEQRNVRVVSPKAMPGRLTASARDLADPANKLYIFDMEGALYEVDVHTLEAKRLFARVMNGAHGKGAYSGQGRLVVANNGNDVVNKAKPAALDPLYATDPEASGSLAEWDGKAWTVLERREFTDITGPGGIDGAPDDNAPLWAIGWDRRSVILKLLDAGQWHSYRLPVGDYSYVARHGWYTEWPRIRDVGRGRMLMNMHGQWFDFPKSFSSTNTAGIRPIGDYLKITGDFCPWKVGGRDQIVFGCDDASIMENPLALQSQSNLWFSSWDGLSRCGRPAGFGGPWVDDPVKAGEPSEPYLLAGYSQRVLHLSHDSDQPVTFTIETDADGHGKWTQYQAVTVPPHGYAWHVVPADVSAEWVRLRTDRDCANTTAYFHYGPGGGASADADSFAAIPDAGFKGPATFGSLRPLGEDRGTLLLETLSSDTPAAAPGKPPAFEVAPDMKFQSYAGQLPAAPKAQGADKDYGIESDSASVILTQEKARFRLPISNAACDLPGGRSIREVVTERFLVNAAGSFFVLPRVTAGGAMRIKPVCTHDKVFSDFCSWRGITVIAGARNDARPDGHYFASSQGGPGLWFGDIDDLWRMGKPTGHGGPWLATPVSADEPSDPYLMAGYDRKSLELSTDAAGTAHITAEVDFLADGTWHPFQTFEVPAGKTVHYDFPAGYAAHWARFRSDVPCRATAQLKYE
jgi:hypothetical protein